MRDHIEPFLRHLSAHRSPSTTRTYGAILALFVDAVATLPPGGTPPTRTDVERFLARPKCDGGRRSPAGRNQELAALRAFTKYATRDLGWTGDPTEGIPFLRDSPHDPPVLSVFELRRLFNVAAEIARPGERSRNLALLALLGQAGLRVHELVALDVDQVDLASATLVAVHGKGATVHDLPLNTPTLALLSGWVGERAAAVPPTEPALFLSSRRSRLSVRSVQHLLVRLRGATGTKKKITPHTLRHSCATVALTLGSDLSTVADLLRHSDLNTTRRYLHLVDERRREAVRRLATAIPDGLIGAAVAAANAPDQATVPDAADAPPSNVTPPEKALDAQYDLNDAAARQPVPAKVPESLQSHTDQATPDLPLAA